MPQKRREFISSMTALLALTAFPPAIATNDKIKALAFDAFAIFDPRPVFKLTEELFQGKGTELNNLWRSRQFEYQWLRLLMERYEDFWTVTGNSLDHAARSLSLELTSSKREQLLNAYLQLKPWPDVMPALQSLKNSGTRLVFLSNMTEQMLSRNITNNQLDKYFDAIYSTDEIRSYKPAVKAYQLAMDKLKLPKSSIGFVAFAAWDAAGAKSFGYPTYWVNRAGQQPEDLGNSPDGTFETLADLAI